jgi:hypothetical protein
LQTTLRSQPFSTMRPLMPAHTLRILFQWDVVYLGT